MDAEGQPLVSFLSSSPVNAKCTNCVRFSPSGVLEHALEACIAVQGLLLTGMSCLLKPCVEPVPQADRVSFLKAFPPKLFSAQELTSQGICLSHHHCR